MPEAFTEAFVAVIFFHRSYRGSFHGIWFLKASVEEKCYLLFLIFIIYFHESFHETFRGSKFTSTKASVKTSVNASVEANLLPRKLP